MNCKILRIRHFLLYLHCSKFFLVIRYCCFFLIFLFTSTSFSKIDPEQGKVRDSIDALLAEVNLDVYNNISRAFVLLERADTLAEKLDRNEKIADIENGYAVAYYVKGDYSASLQHYLKALDIYNENNNQLGIAKSLVGQGLIQQGIDRHEEAIAFFERAVATYEKAGDYAASNPAFLNIAISEIEEGNYDAAREHLRQAIELSQIAKRKGVEHLSLNKLGEVNFLEGKFQQAIQYYLEVLNDVDEPNDWEKSFAHAGLAQSYLNQNKSSLAEEHALKAMDFAQNSKSLWDLERNSRILSEIYAKQGDTGKALEQLQINQKFKDSLYNQKKLREINLLQLSSKEAENARLLAEKEVIEKQLFINKISFVSLLVIAFFLLLFLLLFWKNAKQKELYNLELQTKNNTIAGQNELILKRNEELKAADTTKNQLFSILSHDLRSPVGSIQQLLELNKLGEFTKEEQEGLFDEMLIQVSETSNMLQNVLHWSNSQLNGYKTEKETLDLVKEVSEVLAAYRVPARYKKISIAHDTPSGSPVVDIDKGQLSIILHNLISNAVKYTVEEKKIKVSYEENKEVVLLKVFNEGEGISQVKMEEIISSNDQLPSEIGTGMETGTGIGLLLVKQFLKINNATMDVKSYPGRCTEFSIAFIKSAKQPAVRPKSPQQIS